MEIALVVFDMAGTTVADKGNVNKAFRDAFAAEGIAVSESDVNKLMGYRKIEAIDMVVNQFAPYLGNKKQDTVIRIHEKFNRDMIFFYENDMKLKPLPYAGELFEWLQDQGIKVALNTGFTRQITDTILKRLGWDTNSFINTVICSDEVSEGRPHAYMIQSIMRQLEIADVTTVAKVGDTEVDIMEGQHAGCGMVVAVTTGACNRSQLAVYKPDFIIDSLQELPALIESNVSRFI